MKFLRICIILPMLDDVYGDNKKKNPKFFPPFSFGRCCRNEIIRVNNKKGQHLRISFISSIKTFRS